MSNLVDFRREYLNIPSWTKEDETMWRLAREYHERTEWFDQMHCRVKNEKDIAVPQGLEVSICQHHAMEVWHELYERAVQMGFKGDLQKAIVADARQFEADWTAGKRHLVTPSASDILFPEGEV